MSRDRTIDDAKVNSEHIYMVLEDLEVQLQFLLSALEAPEDRIMRGFMESMRYETDAIRNSLFEINMYLQNLDVGVVATGKLRVQIDEEDLDE